MELNEHDEVEMRISLPDASVTEIFVPDSAFEAGLYLDIKQI